MNKLRKYFKHKLKNCKITNLYHNCTFTLEIHAEGRRQKQKIYSTFSNRIYSKSNSNFFLLCKHFEKLKQNYFIPVENNKN